MSEFEVNMKTYALVALLKRYVTQVIFEANNGILLHFDLNEILVQDCK